MNTDWQETFGHNVSAAEIIDAAGTEQHVAAFLSEQWDEIYQGTDAEKPAPAEFDSMAAQVANDAQN